MKVVLINHFPLIGSGSGVYTLNLAKYLVAKGNEVVVIVPENENCVHYDFEFPVVTVKFNSEEIPFNFPCFTTHPFSEKTFYDMNDDDYELYCEKFRQIIDKVIKNFEPDLIHCGHIWTLSRIAGEYDIPLVITAHGTDLIGFNNCKNQDERYIEDANYAYNKASRIITISKDNLSLVEKIFEKNDKNNLMPNGYDKDMFYIDKTNRLDFLKELGIDREYKKVISFVGKFTEIKRIDKLLQAYKTVEDEDTLLLLAGNGELYDNLVNLSYILNIKNIKFLGNRPQTFLRQLFNISDVSIVPSKDEAFGLVVIEAMACGTPVIGANSGGIPDIIDEKTGLLFEVDNVEDLSAKIKIFFDNQKYYDKNFIESSTYEKYSQENFINYLINQYEEIVGQKRLK